MGMPARRCVGMGDECRAEAARESRAGGWANGRAMEGGRMSCVAVWAQRLCHTSYLCQGMRALPSRLFFHTGVQLLRSQGSEQRPTN